MYLTEKAPAKINLTLDVTGKRPDGFHDLEMVMTTIDIADRILLAPSTDSRIHLETDSGMIPQDERNLAYKAAILLKEYAGVNFGARITIQKRIPIAAGLGGGSSDAAATLRGLNRLWNLGLSKPELAEIGLQVGSDVPFCIYGNTAIVRGRGEIVDPLPTPPLCWVVLAKPEHGVSTGEVFKQMDIEEIQEHPQTHKMIQAIYDQDYTLMNQSLCNVLESVTMRMYPEVLRIKGKMLQFGAEGVLMSGSGPTVFALVQKESRVRRVVNGLKGFCQLVYVVRMLEESQLKSKGELKYAAD